MAANRVIRAGRYTLPLHDHMLIMGIINATPDSFSDGGEFVTPELIAERAQELFAEGADIIDIGAESSRPGAEEIGADEETFRLVPALDAMRSAQIDVPISVDTYKASVAKKALEMGATIINDIWGLRREPDIAHAVADNDAAIVLMHNSRDTRHGPELIREVIESLKHSIEIALQAGIDAESIAIDPGIGFGKSPEQSLEILRNLRAFKKLGFPVLLGASRKSVIGHVLSTEVDQRLEGTLATTVMAVEAHLELVRVHDVASNRRAARMAEAVYWQHENFPKPR